MVAKKRHLGCSLALIFDFGCVKRSRSSNTAKNFVQPLTQITESEIEMTLALSKVKGVGPVLLREMLTQLGSAEAVFAASPRMLEEVHGMGQKVANEVVTAVRFIEEAGKELKFCKAHGLKVLRFDDARYPQRLLNCPDAPAFLFYRGVKSLNPPKAIAVIGTRAATEYGLELTRQFIEDLAPYRPTIISGLADGIDVAAHSAAFDFGLTTLGVMGNGFGMIYPESQTEIARQMMLEAGLLSEFFHTVKVERANFPQRNRIIVGMVDAVVVVEAGAKSGTINTVRLAADYSREAFAFPGRVSDEASAGCHYLIKSNLAALITSAADLAVAFNWEEPTEIATLPPPRRPVVKTQQTDKPLFKTSSSSSKNAPSPKHEATQMITAQAPSVQLNLAGDEKVLHEILSDGAMEADAITQKTGLSASAVLVAAFNLEMQNIIRTLPGKRFERV